MEAQQQPPASSITRYKPRREDFTPIDGIIHEKALQYGVSENTMKVIISREVGSSLDPLVVGDTRYVCPLTGRVAPSYGLVQISSCWHPEISYAQATNPTFAIDFLARRLSEGYCHEWTTCPSRDNM